MKNYIDKYTEWVFGGFSLILGLNRLVLRALLVKPSRFSSTLDHEINSQIFAVTEDVILTTIGFYDKNGRHNHNGENRELNLFLRTFPIVVFPPIEQKLRSILTRDQYSYHHLKVKKYSAFPHPNPFHSGHRLKYDPKYITRARAVLRNPNITIPLRRRLRHYDRDEVWEMLRSWEPRKTSEILEERNRGKICDRHGQTLIFAYSYRAPILSYNIKIREVCYRCEIPYIDLDKPNKLPQVDKVDRRILN